MPRRGRLSAAAVGGWASRGAGPGGGGRFPAVAATFSRLAAGLRPLPGFGIPRLNVVTNGLGQAALVRVTPGDPDHMLEQPDGLAYVSVTNSTDSLDQVRT